ncbi:hypothetical protein SCUP515_12873 [Seiridium cupressi]
MEVIGVIAAVPGLIEIAKGAKSAISSLATQLIAHLEAVTESLGEIEKRWKNISLSSDQLSSLNPLIASSGVATDGPRLLKRAKLLASGYGKKLKRHIDLLERSKSSLAILLLDRTATDVQGKQAPCLSVHLKRLYDRAVMILYPEDSTARANGCGAILHLDTGRNEPQKCHRMTRQEPSNVSSPYTVPKVVANLSLRCLSWTVKAFEKLSVLFSFWAENGSQRKLIDLLRTVRWYLLQEVQDPVFHEISTSIVKGLPLETGSSTAAISVALKAIDSEVYCIIDRVDESIDDWTRPDEGCLKVVLELIQNHPKLHVLLLGREPSLLGALKAAPRSLEVTEGMVRGDIDKLITSELDKCLNTQSEAIRQEAYETLKAKSNSMFLWVVLVFRQLNRCFSDSEVKHELKNTARDLDREYHRLFQRLLERTSGTSSRPSTSMRRSKRLLSIMISAAEPMTASKLCHTYAVQTNPTQSYTDDLPTKEGIVDACGDFVRVTNDRYHITHATVTNFLTRSLSEWLLEDQDIIFLRIDGLESQREMCFSCLDYLSLLDLGYPLAEGSYTTLPSRFPLFSYPLNFIPFHVLQVSAHGPSSCLTSRLETFCSKPQFCAMIGFIIRNISEESWDVAYRYTELIVSTISGPEKNAPNLIELNVDPFAVFANEFLRRQSAFGSEDPRTQSWNLLATSLAVTSIDENHEPNVEPQHVSENTDDYKAIESPSRKPPALWNGDEKMLERSRGLTGVSNNILLATIQCLDANSQLLASTKKVQSAISTTLFNPLLTVINKLAISPSWIVPAPCLIVCALAIERGCRETPEKVAQAIGLVSIARKKLPNKRNFWEALAICHEAWLTGDP